MVRCVKGDVKEDIAREHFKAAEREGRFGVAVVGITQERTSAWRGWRDGGPDGHPHFESAAGRSSERLLLVHPRSRLGIRLLKTTAYAPYSVWLYLNGDDWARDRPRSGHPIHAVG